MSLKLMPRAKAVVFDLDETLIDAQAGLKATHHAVARRLCQYLARSGVKVSEGGIRAKLRALDDRMNIATNYNRDTWWPVLLGEIDAKQKISRPLIKELTHLYWATYAGASEPYPDAEPTLVYLKDRGYKLGLVTDTDGKKGWKKKRVKHFRFAGLFDTIVIGGEDTPRTKPNPESFLLAASKLGLQASDCVFVGDKPFTDIKGAKAAGMRTILLKRRDWGIGDRADFIINSLAELPRVLCDTE
ncbi:MAG: HAD family hydrolase [Candidatus Hadarchaeaceae archaeon]